MRDAEWKDIDEDLIDKFVLSCRKGRASGHVTDSVFSRYNIQTLDRLRKAANLIEAGAIETDKKTDNPPSQSDGSSQQSQKTVPYNVTQ